MMKHIIPYSKEPMPPLAGNIPKNPQMERTNARIAHPRYPFLVFISIIIQTSDTTRNQITSESLLDPKTAHLPLKKPTSFYTRSASCLKY